MKLTLEIDVPDDQLPPNATGRLLWQVPEHGQHVIDADGEVECCNIYATDVDLLDMVHLVIETREPWRVPDHLRHPRYNGWTIEKRASGSIYLKINSRTWQLVNCDVLTDAGETMRVVTSDFDGMEPGVVYKLGEG